MKELLTQEDIQRITKKKKRSVYELFRTTLKAYGAFKLGAEWRIAPEDFQRYIDDLKTEAKTETQAAV